jgi:hypothetical protein
MSLAATVARVAEPLASWTGGDPHASCTQGMGLERPSP